MRLDNARNYLNQTLTPFFQKWVIHESSCVDRITKMDWLSEKIGIYSMLHKHSCFKRMYQKHFGEVVLTTTYLINRVPSQVLGNQSSMNALPRFYSNFNRSFKLPPEVFGCVSFVNIHAYKRVKLDPRALKYVFVWYSTTKKSYKCYHHLTRKTFISMKITFVKKEIISKFESLSSRGESMSHLGF